MHAHEGLGETHFGGTLGFDHDGASLAGDVQQVTCAPTVLVHVLGVEFDHRFRYVPKKLAHQSGSTHAMPMIPQATGIERKRVARLSELCGGFV